LGQKAGGWPRLVPNDAGEVRGGSQRAVDTGRGARGGADLTLVFDKGNNSEQNLKCVARCGLHFVGSLVPTQHPQLLAIPRNQMRRLDKTQLPAVWSHRTEQTVFGVSRTVLVTFNRPLFRAQQDAAARDQQALR
jgi:hypothetical protein